MTPPSTACAGRSLYTITVCPSLVGRTSSDAAWTVLLRSPSTSPATAAAAASASSAKTWLPWPPAGHGGEDGLVVAEPDPDGRQRDAGPPGAGRNRFEPAGIGDALVGHPVGDEHDRRASRAGRPPRLLHPAQQAGGQVRPAARPHGVDRGLDRGLVDQRARRDDDVDAVIERDESERVTGIEPVDEGLERRAR